jgi:hypothetical protein
MDTQLDRLLNPESGTRDQSTKTDGRVKRFPFTVRLATTAEDFRDAVDVRRAGYGRHLPDLAATMVGPDPFDARPDVSVMIVKSKLDGEPLGTARIQLNTMGPLCVEQAVTMPSALQGKRLAEITRLCVVPGSAGMLAKLAIWKGVYFFLEAAQVQWTVAAGRTPLDRQYLDISFEDLYPERGLVPLGYAGNIPHRVMGLDHSTSYQRWKAESHRLFDFVFNTDHPDIEVSDAAVRQKISRIPVAKPIRMANNS